MRDRWTDALLISIFSAALAFQLFVPPSIGLAGNGDFPKMIGRFSLGAEPPAEDYNYFTSRYIYDRSFQWLADDVSSELIPISGGLIIGWIFSRHVFDIRILGAIHAALWIGCFTVLLPLLRRLAGWRRAVITVASLIIFTDVSYVAHFNSFYTDTAAFLFLAWAIVLWLHLVTRERPSAGLFALFCAASILCVTSKPQHAPLGVFLFALAAMTAASFHGVWPKIGATALGLTILLASAVSFALAPAGVESGQVYNAIFAKILPKSPSALEDARELGLGPEYLPLAEHWADPMQSPAWKAEFERRTSHRSVALFYLRHPWRALAIMYRELRDFAWHRPATSLSHYERKEGYPPGTQTKSFGWWSALRSVALRYAPWQIPVLYFAIFAVGGRIAILHRGTPLSRVAALCVLLAGMGAIELAVSALGDGGEDDRHLFLFHVVTDFAIVIGGTWLLWSPLADARGSESASEPRP